jgi:hypothetical protein
MIFQNGIVDSVVLRTDGRPYKAASSAVTAWWRGTLWPGSQEPGETWLCEAGRKVL